MKIRHGIWMAVVATLTLCVGQVGAQEKQDAAKKNARILMVTQSKGFKHGSVSRPESKLSPSEQAVTEIGVASNLFRVDCTQDCEKDFTKENLKNYDIVFFYTTGDLPIPQETLDFCVLARFRFNS